MPLLAAVFDLDDASLYTAPVVTAQQKERSAHSKKPTQFHYVCPMHEDVTSKTRGDCPEVQDETGPEADRRQRTVNGFELDLHEDFYAKRKDANEGSVSKGVFASLR